MYLSRRLGSVFLLIALCLILPSFLKAQTGSAGNQESWPLLIGADTGLYGLDRNGRSVSLWTGGQVRKIIRAGSSWAILGSQGVLVSPDLRRWESRNAGLPVKTIKVYEGGRKSFIPTVQEIKDLEINPANPEIFVCATKDTVYLSRNGGRSWESLGTPPYRTNGIKAVASAYLPGPTPELTVFLSHSTYGIHYITPGKQGAKWTELNTGIEKLETTGNADETADIAVVQSAANGPAEIYASQTFRGRIYRLDWNNKRFITLWSDNRAFGTADSLDPGPRGIRFVREGMVSELGYPDSNTAAPGAPQLRDREDLRWIAGGIQKNLGLKPNCVVIQENNGDAAQEEWMAAQEIISLSELWLLDEAPAGAAAGHEGLYLPVNHAMDSRSLKPYLDIIAARNLDMVVIDMKDDYGRLRFTPKNPGIANKGRVFRPLDIDSFLADMKKRGIYTAARVVVFKDPELAAKEGGKYAVWDAAAGKPWVGYYDVKRKKVPPETDERRTDLTELLSADDPAFEILRTYYDEKWVDPYSEEVWDYIAAVAGELHERGFDEIQFDYIRFPTDGDNLSRARYRWQDSGMDMESAMVSFLRHIRSRLAAPISIDIYGANGWYRTGARTGQEVELLAPYVDVICPMYYPSHFEQDFLAQNPPELRPYRIYYQGTQRTSRIGRGQIIVRPYVQAFYLNVLYDRKYYNPDYVRREVEGVRDAGSGGLTYWNNSGRYEDIPTPGE
ncbi:hypothetical protein AGMMS50268_25300 [Spirochaetia bacterium]|nr:hypothetical protein AGMMS50268_25300 [Spirochaetia bacterium]